MTFITGAQLVVIMHAARKTSGPHRKAPLQPIVVGYPIHSYLFMKGDDVMMMINY